MHGERDKKCVTDLERVARKRKTVDAQGNPVKGDPRANDPEMHMTRKGMRGQTLPVGGCGSSSSGRVCSCQQMLTCPMWLTSTEDLPAAQILLRAGSALEATGHRESNHFVVEQQERIIANLTIRIKSLEDTEMDGTFAVDGALAQLRPIWLKRKAPWKRYAKTG